MVQLEVGVWTITASPLEIWQVAQEISLEHFWAESIIIAERALFTLPGIDPLGLCNLTGDVDTLRIFINADWFGHADVKRSDAHPLVSVVTLFATPEMREVAEEQLQILFTSLVDRGTTVEKRWGLENIARTLVIGSQQVQGNVGQAAPAGEESTVWEENQLSTAEKNRLRVCRQAVEAKINGTNFVEFCQDKYFTPETLRRWMRDLKAKGVTGLDWQD